ncbi:MAG TPA: amidohydrolase family protein [Acidimicrobiales bacterium]
MSTSEERICVISGDGHVGPPTEVYKDYLEKWLHPAFDEFEARHVSRWSAVKSTSFYGPDMNVKFRQAEGFDPEHGTSVAWDPQLRLKAMDQAMVACDVVLPDDTNDNDPPFGAGLANAMVDGPEGALDYPPELVRAGARSYNRWLADFCSTDPNRLRGLTTLGTLDDLVWCIDEIHRSYEAGLRTGVLLPLEYYLPMYHHPRYDMLWEVLTELDLPVVSHIGRGYPSYLGEDPRVQLYMYTLEGWGVLRPVWSMILGGVFERNPRLRLVVAEASVEWAAPMVGAYDAILEWWPGMRAEAQRDVPRRVDYSMKPSEYFAEHCFVTHSIGQKRSEFEAPAFGTVPNMMFGSDIGHLEGWWPTFGLPSPVPENLPSVFYPLPEAASPADAMRTVLGGLPVSTVVPYLQDNAVRAYPSIDLDALAPVAERVCPTVGDLGLV